MTVIAKLTGTELPQKMQLKPLSKWPTGTFSLHSSSCSFHKLRNSSSSQDIDTTPEIETAGKNAKIGWFENSAE